MRIAYHENTCKSTYIVPHIVQPTPIHEPHITYIWASNNIAIKPTLNFLKRFDSFLPGTLTILTVNKLQIFKHFAARFTVNSILKLKITTIKNADHRTNSRNTHPV